MGQNCSESFQEIMWAAQTVKSLPAMLETWVQSLGQEDPLEKKMATHSSKIPWTVEPARLQSSPWGHKELDMTE